MDGSTRSISQTELLPAGMGLLGEQSDREANECWPNRWVVALLHWRGIAGDVLHRPAELGAVFVLRVDLLCTGRARGVGDTRSPRKLD